MLTLILENDKIYGMYVKEKEGDKMKKFVPKMYQKSIYEIDYKALKKRGIRLLLFDLDNTCVGYHEKMPTMELKKLFKKLEKLGFIVIIFSNAPKKRLVPFQELGVICHHSSMKPFTYHFKRVMMKYKFSKDEVCIIGDQLFTDVCGGNRVGIVTCLVDPITNEDFIFTKIFRAMEGFVFFSLANRNILKKGRYYE